MLGNTVLFKLFDCIPIFLPTLRFVLPSSLFIFHLPFFLSFILFILNILPPFCHSSFHSSLYSSIIVFFPFLSCSYKSDFFHMYLYVFGESRKMAWRREHCCCCFNPKISLVSYLGIPSYLILLSEHRLIALSSIYFLGKKYE